MLVTQQTCQYCIGPVLGQYWQAGINGIGPIHTLHSGCESGQCCHVVLPRCWANAGPALGQCWRNVLVQYWPSTGMLYWPSAGVVMVQHWASIGAMYWPSAGPVPVPVLAWSWPSTGKVHRRVNVPLLVQYIIVCVWDSNKKHDMKQNEINFI